MIKKLRLIATPAFLLSIFRLHISDEQLKRRMLMAVPKKGRLYDHCISMLERAGIKV